MFVVSNQMISKASLSYQCNAFKTTKTVDEYDLKSINRGIVKFISYKALF